MREVTKLMIKEFNIKNIGLDFMGYKVKRTNELTFHHTIVPRRNCKKMGLGEGYYRWNGSLLMPNPHEYLHLIEAKDYDMFIAITSELVDENVQGKITKENLMRIRDVLQCFEKEHCSDRGKKGKILIKEEYLKRPKI